MSDIRDTPNPGTDSESSDDSFDIGEDCFVVSVRELEQTRDAASAYLQNTAGFCAHEARRLAAQLRQPTEAENIQDVVSDLISKQNPASFICSVCRSGGQKVQRPIDAETFAHDARHSAVQVISSFPALRANIEAASGARSLANIMRSNKSFELALGEAAAALDDKYSRGSISLSREVLAKSFELIVDLSASHAAASTIRDNTSPEVFYAGVIMSRIRPREGNCKSTGSAAARTGSARQPQRDDQTFDSSPVDRVVSSPPAGTLDAFESELAIALALSGQEQTNHNVKYTTEDMALSHAVAESLCLQPANQDRDLAHALALSLELDATNVRNHQNQGSTYSESSVDELVNLGFERSVAASALKATNGNVQAAANLLLS